MKYSACLWDWNCCKRDFVFWNCATDNALRGIGLVRSSDWSAPGTPVSGCSQIVVAPTAEGGGRTLAAAGQAEPITFDRMPDPSQTRPAHTLTIPILGHSPSVVDPYFGRGPSIRLELGSVFGITICVAKSAVPGAANGWYQSRPDQVTFVPRLPLSLQT